MQFQKTILVLIISLLLGQSVLASADVHLLFEETDTHHQAHDLETSDIAESSDHSGDDCGHCCHTHGCNMPLGFQDQSTFSIMKDHNDSSYLDSFISNITSPSYRPPIA